VSDAEPMPPSIRKWSGGGRDELAAVVRRLVVATVTSGASASEMANATARLSEVADELEHARPEPDVESDASADMRRMGSVEVDALTAAMPFDVVVGSCNPLAPPVSIVFEPPKAIGTVVFTVPYQGAPGWVHGAVLAGVFDIVLTAANALSDAAGPTTCLTIRYLKPTYIDRPARFEGWVTSVEGRRTKSHGQLIQDGVVTVEADGEFVAINHSLIDAIHGRNGDRADLP
jgi:acyl-coenzyme A thioesterase PaaI-like protein